MGSTASFSFHHTGREGSRFYRTDPESLISEILRNWANNKEVTSYPELKQLSSPLIVALPDRNLMITAVARHMGNELRYSGFVSNGAAWDDAHGEIFLLHDWTTLVVKPPR